MTATLTEGKIVCSVCHIAFYDSSMKKSEDGKDICIFCAKELLNILEEPPRLKPSPEVKK